MKSIIITGCDANYFHFVEGLVCSLRQWPQLAGLPVGLLDFGLDDRQRQWLAEQGVDVRPGGWDFEFAKRDAWEATKPWFKAYLCRPHLRKHFAGFDVYGWLDADTWVQRPEAVELLLACAGRGGLAAVPEIDRCYAKFVINPLAWEFEAKVASHCLGPELAASMRMLPQFNAGVFAMRHDAPHWEHYREYLQIALERVDPADSLSRFAEQVAFNAAITRHNGLTHRLPSTVNWMSLYAAPAFDVGSGLFVEPLPPHQPIGIIHLTTDVNANPLPVTGIDSGESCLAIRTPLTFAGLANLQRSLPQMRALIAEKRSPPASDIPPAQQQSDYVSPGLERIDAAGYFPHRVIGDRAGCSWPYLRREVPHHWYVDRRSPKTGFLNVDESHILYNLATEFRGRRALEIGCWMGWSACHLALAGVVLDVIDPVLANPQVRGAVSESIVAAGVHGSVVLIAGESPYAVGEFARSEGRRWSLCFIDGNHDGQAPLLDAQACEPLMEPDAAIVFHDLVAPDVAAGLAYLRDRGWQTRIYQTMQIMGIAWRGAVTPPRHTPDPAVAWTLPDHLAGFQLAERAEGLEDARATEASRGAEISRAILPTRSMPTSPRPISALAIHLGWQLTPWTGWGRYGLSLATALRNAGSGVVVDGVAGAQHCSAAEQQSLSGVIDLFQRASTDPPIPVAVSLQAIGNRGSCSPRSQAVAAERAIGVIFSEDTRWLPEEVARLNELSAVVAGSTWNAAVLRAAGVRNVVTILQGIDPELWCQTAPDRGFAARLAGRFALFSGGKLEFRKGQDIVLAAFRRFHSLHPDAVLVTAWQNPWPETIRGIDLAGHVTGLPKVVTSAAGDSLDLATWAATQGIERSAFIDLGLLAGHELPRWVRGCDLAVFANRAEGGTNLVAMECIAAGLPTVLSGNTGHLDLADDATMLSRQGRVPAGCPFYRDMTGWGETSVDDLVAAMEQGYAQRHAPRAALAARGREFAARCSWRENARQMFGVLGLSGEPYEHSQPTGQSGT